MKHIKPFNESETPPVFKDGLKFTFKTTNPTGRYKSFDSAYHDIKLKGKVVGSIGDKAPHKIRLMIIKNDINSDGNPNCPWKWIILKKESGTIDAAKQWLNDNIKGIMDKYKLQLLEQ